MDMADKDVSGKAVPERAGATRRAFLSASAVTAVTVPLLGGTAVAATDLPAGGQKQQPDKELRDLLGQVDPERIKATIPCRAQKSMGLRRPVSTSSSVAPL